MERVVHSLCMNSMLCLPGTFCPLFRTGFSFLYLFRLLKEFTWKCIFSGFNYMQRVHMLHTHKHTYEHIQTHKPIVRSSLCLSRSSPPLLSLVYFTVDYIVVLTHCLISRECPRMGVAAAEHNYEEYYKRQIKTNRKIQFSIIWNLWPIKL